MSERPKPFPDIPRFPGEPKLDGPPRHANKSLFLTTPGLSETMELITRLRGLNSDRRREFFKKNLDTLPPEIRDQIIGVATDIARGVLTDSDNLKLEASALAEKLQPGVTKTERPTFATEILDMLVQTETFGPHIEVFSSYLNSRVEESSRVLGAHARNLLTAPDKILKHIRVVNAVEEGLADDPSIQSEEIASFRVFNEKLKQALESLVERQQPAEPETANLYQWMKLLCSDSEYSEVAEKFLYTWLNVHDFSAAIDRLYQLATAAFTSDDRQLQRKMVDILSLNTGVMPIDSPAAIMYIVASIPVFPKEWQKAREIGDAEKVLMSLRPLQGRLQLVRQAKTRAFQEYAKRLKARGVVAKRGDTVDQVLDRAYQELGSRVWRRLWPQRNPAIFEDDPIMRDSLLRRWVTERTSSIFRTRRLWGRKRILSGAIQLPGISHPIKAPLAHVTAEVSKAISQVSARELVEPQNWRTLALLVPPNLDQNKLDDLKRTNSLMLADIQKDRLRGFSQRGDEIHITSPVLRELGFTKLELHSQDDGYDAAIEVLGKLFKGRLNKDFQLVDSVLGARLRMPITGTFLRHVIVCHLHELLCSEWEDEESDGTSEATRQFYSRRDHQRILPFGERPTKGQIVKALYDYGIDLVARNNGRMVSGETRFVTWVSAVDRIDMNGVGPVESYAQNATEQLDRILAR